MTGRSPRVRHVYIYVHDLRSSGVVRNAIDYAARIARDAPTVLVAGYGQGFFREQAAAGGFGLHVLAQTPGPLPRLAAALRLRRWLRGQPPGVLLSAGNMGHPTPYLACRGLDHIARVYRISNEIARGDGLRSRLRQRWMARLMRDATRIALVGRALRRLDLFAGAVASGFAIEVPNGVDLDHARARAAEPIPHAWLEQDVPVVVAIGRLRPQKNFDLLIDAVGRARGARRLRLVIIGGGTPAERARLGALAAGWEEDFLLAGEIDNVFAWLARATVFALPSRWEGSSLALLEALAVGVPVVASRLAGDAAYVLGEGRYGRLFDGVDAQALADALLGQCGPDRVLPGDRAEAFSEEAAAEAHAALVRDVLRSSPRFRGEGDRVSSPDR